MTRNIRADDVGALLQPGMTVFVQGSTGQPQSLLNALAQAAHNCTGVHFISVLTPGINAFPLEMAPPDCKLTTFFDYKDLRRSFLSGEVEFIPCHYSQIADYLRGFPSIDLALIQLSSPDGEGKCSTGLSADFVPDILDRCKLVVAELNRRMPSLHDAPAVPMDRLDYIVEADYQLPQMPAGSANSALEAIAGHVSDLVQDGDTLQFGIGRIPPVALSRLQSKNDLGLHSGLVTPAVRPLIESGIVTGARKSLDVGKHVAGAAVGDDAFYAWLAERPDVSMRPVSYTHSARVLAELDNFVALNSAIEVDLFGQANAEMVNGRQVSGTGGLVDFIRGASLSKGGRALICLQATSDQGRRSNIVPKLASVTSVCRTDTQYVVTEYGVASMAVKSIKDRAEALISVAAPQFRDPLRDAWAELTR